MSCMFSCCCCPPAPPCVIFPKGEGKGRVCAGSEQGGCHCLSSECPFLWPLKGAPGGHEAVALPHTRSQSWPAWIALNTNVWEEVTPAVTADGQDGASTQGQCHKCSLWTLLCALQAKLWEGQGRDRGGAAGPIGHRLLSERPHPGAAPLALASLGELSPFQIRPWATACGSPG